MSWVLVLLIVSVSIFFLTQVAISVYRFRDEYNLDEEDLDEIDIKNGRIESEEEKINSHLVEAWNIFSQLSVQHPDDINEFRISLHRLQHLMGMRELRRMKPEEWYNAQDEKW